MKHWFQYTSYGLNAVLIIVVITISISSKNSQTTFDPQKHTQQPLDKSIEIQRNMSTKEVEHIMGKPIRKEITAIDEEWHYCRTGEILDEYIAIKFKGQKVSELLAYTVSALDIAYHHTDTPNPELARLLRSGDCKRFIRWGTYGKTAPNKQTKKETATPSQ